MADLPGNKNADNIFLRMRSIHRLLIGTALSVLTFLFIRHRVADSMALIMILWDVFCLAVLTCAWVVFFTCSPARLRKIASKEDGSRAFVFILILVSSLTSMAIVLSLIISDDFTERKLLYITVSIAGMLLSWLMVHTTFCFHYAFMYYGDDEATPGTHAGGLEFPKEKAPDYLDFAYFAFVIGMTFQVSDVEISSRRIRRLALVHGLLSFALNTFVVALTVNLIAGIKVK